MSHDGSLEKMYRVEKIDVTPSSSREEFPPWYIELRKVVLRAFKEPTLATGLSIKHLVSRCGDEHKQLALGSLASGSDSNVDVALLSLVSRTLRKMEERGEIIYNTGTEKWVKIPTS